MRFLVDQKSYDEMLNKKDLTPDCYVRPGEYLHHMYIDGIRYIVALAVENGLSTAEEKHDIEAYRHLQLHKEQLDQLTENAHQTGGIIGGRLLGDLPPGNDDITQIGKTYHPSIPLTLERTGLNRGLVTEMILRSIYNLGRPTGGDLSRDLGLSYQILGLLLKEMRQKELIDVVGQKGIGDISYEYILKIPRGSQMVEEALKKTDYTGPAPVVFGDYIKAVQVQTIRNLLVTRRNIRNAFSDLVVSDAVLNEVGPAINSADSIFLFGFPGNGKTSIAERITRLMGDDIYIPYAIEADGQIIKIYDPTLHQIVKTQEDNEANTPFSDSKQDASLDLRWVKVKRPAVVVGGELTLPMLDLTYNQYGKFYEAPVQMKANNGIFMIDDFGRQMVRPIDLLNRWIVPLEEKYDYLSTITGKKLQIPFDVLLIFSTNIDPNQLVDEAFLRRIKFKIEIKDPDENQWRQIWELVCNHKKIPVDPKGLDYMVEKWYMPFRRPFRMCHPRDIFNHMASIAKYNMERLAFTPDLIDAACQSYFINIERKDFGAKVRLE